ncbi:MAG: hypothetical protein IPG48_03415 [Saprospiraceae bacterium]|nr:hypothetical protein [Saprospiraceae bacterium]MBK6665207.1 hypothetical protein [Saprospiraceae bacterium]MBK8826858.1 hypothetical protein [Saprospiraceae bacterium]
MKKVFAIILIMSLPLIAKSQLTVSPELELKIKDKRNFSEIMNLVNKHYNDLNFKENKKFYSEYKKWNRWAWWASRHQNARGEVDFSTTINMDEALNRTYESSQNFNSNTGNWTSIGPRSMSWHGSPGSKGIGRIDRLAAHPTNPNIILAASPAGGLWRTDDGGDYWYSISSNLPNCGIGGVVFDNQDPSGNTIYILTGEHHGGNYFISNFGFRSYGVLKTTNGGAIWKQLGNSGIVMSNATSSFKLIQLTGSPNILLAVTNIGICRSNNGGLTWTYVVNSSFLRDITQHPTQSNIVYACYLNDVIKSSNSGETFLESVSIPSFSGTQNSLLATTPSNPDEVYFAVCGSTNRIYKSTNKGTDFSLINSTDLVGGQYWYNFALAVNPNNNNFIAVGGLNISISTNNGTDFTTTTSGNVGLPAPANYVHSDIQYLLIHPINNLIYAASDGGISVSADNGVTWVDKLNGLQCTAYYQMDGWEGDPNRYIGGTQDNGTHTTTNGSDMYYSGSGDGYSVSFATSNVFYQVENTNIFKYTINTATRSFIGNGIPAVNRKFFPNIQVHPTNSNILYVAYDSTTWKSIDAGSTWTSISSTFGVDGSKGQFVRGGLAVSSNAPDKVLLASWNTIRQSNDQGTNWTTISGTTGWPANLGFITDISMNQANANEIWVTASSTDSIAARVIYSGDSGATWVDFTASLPNIPVYSCVVTDDGDVYIGTSQGVYFMDFLMNDWVPFYNGLPIVPVTDLFVNTTNGLLTASTLGRGLWKTDLYTDCQTFEPLIGAIEGRYRYQASGTIESTQSMLGSYGNNLAYRADTKIRLLPGFKIEEGAYFHGQIAPCGQGIFNVKKPLPSSSK